MALLSICSAKAHDLQTAVEHASPAVIVRSTYAGTEPVAFAQVLIYSPANAKTEFQNGRTDAKGGFAFLPDQDGNWRVVIDDDLGHRVEVRVPVILKRPADSYTAGSGTVSTLYKASFGLAVIFGVTGMLFWWRAREALRRRGA